ncbi:mitochondrial import inner membrane translocase subunit tim54 [Boothiomyces macroporosus]|uniref:Mitochondrial import inner membrane translocase subunit TIM54 n=1 Tax=Boothiomyces macroporosus TaxID=261099 RepID=A0AAD5Y689_9FUNG|nr:mitochondrial import inner membrane translocase subunit tim54 [Boothiomyces macroporosus]
MRVLSVDSNCKCISNCKRDSLEALRGYWKGIKPKERSFLPNELKEYFVTRVKPQHAKEKVNYLNVDMNKMEKHAARKPIERHIYVEVKKSAKEIQTQTTADIQDYYTVLRTIVAEINPNPSHESENENISEIGIKSEPELNLSIAHDTNSFVGAVSGIIVYDRFAVKRILREYGEQASVKAKEPSKWNEPARKVAVYLDHNNWTPYWFDEFVKPIFDDGAVDYELIDPIHSSEIIAQVRDKIWDGKEFVSEKLKPKPAKKASWFGSSSVSTEEQKDQLMQLHFPHLQKLKYDPSIGLVAVGAIGWRHLLCGLMEGHLTSRNDVPFDHELEYPTLGFISTKNLSGWGYVPIRMYYWFNRRELAEKIGKEALAVVLGNKRGFKQEDTLLGSDNYRPLEKKKDASEAVLEKEKLSDMAESIAKIDDGLASKLYIYK